MITEKTNGGSMNWKYYVAIIGTTLSCIMWFVLLKDRPPKQPESEFEKYMKDVILVPDPNWKPKVDLSEESIKRIREGMVTNTATPSFTTNTASTHKLIVEERPENLKKYWKDQPHQFTFIDKGNTERWLELERINKEEGWTRANCIITLNHKPTVTESNGTWTIKFEKGTK